MIIIMKILIIQVNPKMSLIIKYKLKEILFKFLLVPKGFEEPVMWRKNKCKRIMNKIRKGRKKWREKKRLRVALLIENPPQIHITISLPINGIVEIRLVITIAPQNDIWPHGRTYPKKAVAIEIKKIEIPIIHVLVSLKEW